MLPLNQADSGEAQVSHLSSPPALWEEHSPPLPFSSFRLQSSRLTSTWLVSPVIEQKLDVSRIFMPLHLNILLFHDAFTLRRQYYIVNP